MLKGHLPRDVYIRNPEFETQLSVESDPRRPGGRPPLAPHGLPLLLQVGLWVKRGRERVRERGRERDNRLRVLTYSTNSGCGRGVDRPEVLEARWKRRAMSLSQQLKLTTGRKAPPRPARSAPSFFIDNLLVRIHLIIVMIRWTGLAPCELEFHVPDSLIFSLMGE